MKKRLAIQFFLFCFIINFLQAQGNYNWFSKGIGGGGALFSPSINPSNENEYSVACDMGELFHTLDFGLNYNQLPFGQFGAGHFSVVNYTNISGLIYSINYLSEVATPSYSTDYGQTWQILSGVDEWEDYYGLWVDYNNPDNIITNSWDILYFSDDGGNTFTEIYTETQGNGILVGGVYFSENNIFIGTIDGLIVSTDNGANFEMSAVTGLGVNEQITGFAGASDGITTRLYCITGEGVWNGIEPWEYWDALQNVYSLDWGNGSWTNITANIDPAEEFITNIAMAEDNIDVVYLAGSNTSGVPVVMKTVNSGNSWQHVFLSENNQNIFTGWSGYGGDRGWWYGEVVFDMAVAKYNSDKILITDFGFVHKSSDGGNTWHQAYLSSQNENPMNQSITQGDNYSSCGLENTTCWQMLWIDQSNIFSCYSDIKGLRSTDAGVTWSFNYTGHDANSMYRIEQHSNGTLYAATSDIHDIYQSTRLADETLDAFDDNGKIIYSTNNGEDWQDLHVFNHPVFWVKIDPNNPNRMYASVIHYNAGAGDGGIWVTNNLQDGASSIWTKLSNPPRTEGHPATIIVLDDGNVVCTYSGRRTGAGFTASSGTFLYNIATTTWSDVSDEGMLYWTKDIVLDPDDSGQNTWYVCVFSGWGGAPNGLGGLYKTTDRGTNWTKINDIDRVSSITFNPQNSSHAFITTEYNGLWESFNIQSDNPEYAQINSYLFRQPERVFFNPFNNDEVWVTSFGNGMKMMNLNSSGINVDIQKSKIVFYPNPAKDKLSWNVKENINKIEIIDLQGSVLISEIIEIYENSLNIQNLKNGYYLIKFYTENETITEEFIKF
jgi:hypothetical protein